jgi:hypothetical protein
VRSGPHLCWRRVTSGCRTLRTGARSRSQSVAQRRNRRLGQAGDVGGQKVRYERGDGFTHDFKGYDAARQRLGADCTELLADVRAGERSVPREIIGIVGETMRGGTQRMLREAFDLSSGNSVMVSQPFKKSFLRKKRIGAAQALGPAAPLQYTRTNPELKKLVSQLADMATARLAERQAELSVAGLEMLHFFFKRGGEHVSMRRHASVPRDPAEDLVYEAWGFPISGGQPSGGVIPCQPGPEAERAHLV